MKFLVAAVNKNESFVVKENNITSKKTITRTMVKENNIRSNKAITRTMVKENIRSKKQTC